MANLKASRGIRDVMLSLYLYLKSCVPTAVVACPEPSDAVAVKADLPPLACCCLTALHSITMMKT